MRLLFTSRHCCRAACDVPRRSIAQTISRHIFAISLFIFRPPMIARAPDLSPDAEAECVRHARQLMRALRKRCFRCALRHAARLFISRQPFSLPRSSAELRCHRPDACHAVFFCAFDIDAFYRHPSPLVISCFRYFEFRFRHARHAMFTTLPGPC